MSANIHCHPMFGHLRYWRGRPKKKRIELSTKREWVRMDKMPTWDDTALQAKQKKNHLRNEVTTTGTGPDHGKELVGGQMKY